MLSGVSFQASLYQRFLLKVKCVSCSQACTGCSMQTSNDFVYRWVATHMGGPDQQKRKQAEKRWTAPVILQAGFPKGVLLLNSLQLLLLPMIRPQHLPQLLFTLTPDCLIQGHQLSNALLLSQHHLPTKQTSNEQASMWYSIYLLQRTMDTRSTWSLLARHAGWVVTCMTGAVRHCYWCSMIARSHHYRAHIVFKLSPVRYATKSTETGRRVQPRSVPQYLLSHTMPDAPACSFRNKARSHHMSSCPVSWRLGCYCVVITDRRGST